jgi:hypothetical protein
VYGEKTHQHYWKEACMEEKKKSLDALEMDSREIFKVRNKKIEPADTQILSVI